MTWKELKDALVKLNIDDESTNNDVIAIDLENCRLYFRKDGNIDAEFDIGKNNCGGLDVSAGRTYEQIYQLIKALY